MHNSLAALALAALVQSGKAAIGPTATLNIVNANVSPDGFERAAVLANSVYPAPLITSTLVCFCITGTQTVLTIFQGDTFTLTVNDQLTDTTMERATSIVSTDPLHLYTPDAEPTGTYSIGTVCSRTEPTLKTVYRLSLSAPSFPTIPTPIILPRLVKLEHIGAKVWPLLIRSVLKPC